ncbi:IucA/IucC family protein, partial [Micromonospora aurantiaca]|nr:IucA/IucC family protein [Micromonospora aurantiaca]
GTFYETLAAYNGHPVHPAGLGRAGLSLADLSRYAPEFAPSFPLRWASVRNAELTGTLPEWWPAPSDVGSGAAGALFPVHPLAVPHVRKQPGAVVAPEPFLLAGPTLSMRTVAVLNGDAPLVHVKMPLPTSTLGLRNRRTIMPGTLPDGALVERVLRQVLQREPGLPVLLADE